MNKIKSIRQLLAEKKQIRQQQEEIEMRIHTSWGEVKENLRPAAIAKEIIGGIFKKRTDANKHDDSLLKKAMNFGLKLLADKLTKKAGEKYFKKNA